MGAVYEAEQDHPRCLVVLKIIKAAWASPELLRQKRLDDRWRQGLSGRIV
jgi:hypothetical protein